MNPHNLSELDPTARQHEALQQAITPQFQAEVGHAAVDLIEISEAHDALAAHNILTPQAALLSITSGELEQSVVSLKKLGEFSRSNTASDFLITETMAPISYEQAAENSAKVIISLKEKFPTFTAPIEAGSMTAEQFDKTQRGRRMFTSSGNGAGRNESYASQLFVGSSNPELLASVTESLSGKRVLNLGGGDARLTAEFKENGAQDVEVINIEPFPSQLVLEASDETLDHAVIENPAQADFFEKSELPVDSADEIWAVFSVPAYLGSKEEVANLFANITKAIKPGGIVRLSHFGLVRTEGHSQAEREGAVIAALEKASEDGFLLELPETRMGAKTLIMTAPNDNQSK